MPHEPLHDASMALVRRTMRASRATFREEGRIAYSVDPVFTGLQRNRVNAELLKAALRLPAEDASSLGYDAPFQEKLARRLLSAQKPEGSWHEIHPRYDEPSALATAFMAEAILHYVERTPDLPAPLTQEIEVALARARDFVLDNEVRPGFYRKSAKYAADHLNVDASCGAFLAEMARHRKDATARAAALRAALHVAREQFPDGAWPYTTADDGTPYPFPLHVPCIHYQGVTGYYLAKIHDAVPSPEAERSLRAGAAWLAGVQRPSGRFDWSRSHMMFAYCLTGAYAFGAALFAYCARWDARFEDNARRAICALAPDVPGLAQRWESSTLWSFPVGAATAVRSGWHRKFPLGHNSMRVGYGVYRQLARRRRSNRAEDRLFHFLQRTLRINASTVDPSKNYPDLFMTAEIADCLAFAATIAKSTTPTAPTPEASSP